MSTGVENYGPWTEWCLYWAYHGTDLVKELWGFEWSRRFELMDAALVLLRSKAGISDA